MNKEPLHKYSLLVFLLFAFVILFINIKNPPKNILTYDVFGYYLYLPGTFIYQQLEFTDVSKLEEINETYQNTGSFYQITKAPNGNSLIRYPVGLALLYLPFFLAGHVLSFWYEVPADGFSSSYNYAMLAGGLFYSLLGIWILRKVLLKYLSDHLVAITLLILIFATNYIYKATYKGINAHNIIFTLYALILWLTILWHETPRLKYAALLGLLCGITILSRPSEIVCLLIPLFWNVSGWSSFKEKLTTLLRKYGHVLLFAAMLALMSVPQLAYWKFTTGHYLFYSYNNPGEGFDFLSPYIPEVLFSFRKGWLIYSPAMVFAIVGFYHLYRRKREIFLPTMFFFLLNLWFVASWSNWWYAESFGSRALVQSYAVLALPLGFFVSSIAENRKRWIRGTIAILTVLFIALNIFQMWQLRQGILDASRMTRAYYFATFGKTSVGEEEKKLLLVDRSNEVFPGEGHFARKTWPVQDFSIPEKGLEKAYSAAHFLSPPYSWRLDSSFIYSPAVAIPYRLLATGEYAWIRVTANLYLEGPVAENEALLVAAFSNRNGYYKYQTINLSDPTFQAVPGQWNRISILYMTPEVRSTDDEFSTYVWYQGKSAIYLDDLQVEIFTEQEE
jgi:hypothetical protein